MLGRVTQLFSLFQSFLLIVYSHPWFFLISHSVQCTKTLFQWHKSISLTSNISTLHCRSMALVVILIRAGLGLDPVALRKLSFGVVRLAFLPCLAETITATVMSHLLLGFPWLWGLLLGLVKNVFYMYTRVCVYMYVCIYIPVYIICAYFF